MRSRSWRNSSLANVASGINAFDNTNAPASLVAVCKQKKV
jgi:hypothetical protein